MSNLVKLLNDRLIVLEAQKEGLEATIKAYKQVIDDLSDEMCVDRSEEESENVEYYDVSVKFTSKSVNDFSKYKNSSELNYLLKDLSNLKIRKGWEYKDIDNIIKSIITNYYFDDLYLAHSYDWILLSFYWYAFDVEDSTLTIYLEFN